MENGITKRQSVILQGVAVWMMVYHHIFLGVTVYEAIFPFMRPEVVTRIAWFCKICVSIFAFISGYGLYYSMEKMPRESFFRRMGAEYRHVFRRIIKVYGKLWLVLFFYLVYAAGIRHAVILPEQLLGNMTALTPVYNGAWWYVEQYAKMLLLLPFLDLLLTHFELAAERKKKRLFYAAAAALVLAVLLGGGLWAGASWESAAAIISWFRPAFAAVFAVGYLMARCRVYERVEALRRRRNGMSGKAAALCLSAALIGIVIAVRVALAPGPAYAETDFLLTPFFIYGVLTILSCLKPLETFFAWWGRYSTYIWLVHGFLHIPTLYITKSFTRLDLPIYLGTLVFSALAAVLLTRVESLIGRLLSLVFRRRESRESV